MVVPKSKGKKRKPRQRPTAARKSQSKTKSKKPSFKVPRTEIYQTEPVPVRVEDVKKQLKTADDFEEFQESFFDGEFEEDSTVTIETSNTLNFTDATIRGVMSLCRCGQPTQLVWQGKGLDDCKTLLDVAMKVEIEADDILGYCRLSNLFVTALASLPKKQVGPLVKRAHERMKSLGFEGDDLRKFRKEEQEKRSKFEEDRLVRKIKIIDIFPHLPFATPDPAVVVPSRYRIDGYGVRDAIDESKKIISAPLFIERTLQSTCGTYQMVSIWFRTAAGWRNRIVPRDVICDKHKLLECAKYGLAVTNDNALEVVRYLRAFEQANESRFTVTKVTDRLGRHQVERRLPVVKISEVKLSKKSRAAHEKRASAKVAKLPPAKRAKRKAELIAKYEAKALEKIRRKKAAKLAKEYEFELSNSGTPPELPNGFETVTTTTFVMHDRVWSTHFVEPEIEFASKDSAIHEQVAGFRSKGELSEYLRLVELTGLYPRVRLMVVAAFTPLLRVFIDFDNVILDICGRTTSGKTTALRLAAAGFGCPDPSDPGGSVIFQLSGTPTFNERRAGLLRNLPMLMDESKVGNLKQLSKFAYMVAGGMSKGRGTVAGVQNTTHFETIGIFTGEEPIVSASKSGGAHVRIPPFYGSPFDEESAEIGALADEINEVVSSNYGHAVRAFLDYSFDNQCSWPEWKKTFTNHKKHFKDLADEEGNKYVARLAPTLAAFKLCEELLKKALKIPTIDVVEKTWQKFAVETAVADQSKVALEYVYNYYVANRDKFWRDGKRGDCPANGWAGKVKFSAVPDEQDNLDFSGAYLGFMQATLDRILAEAGFDANAILRQWKLDDLLLCDKKRNTHQVWINSERVRLVAIRKTAIDDMNSGDDTDVEDDAEGPDDVEE